MAGIQIAFEDDVLVDLSDDRLILAGKLATDALMRKRNQLICDRDGHVPDPLGVICERCVIVLDDEAWKQLHPAMP